MHIGSDMDGREIVYHETAGNFTIGGIATPIERLVAYDRGAQVNWASDEIRVWAQSFGEDRQKWTAEIREAQARTAREVADQQTEAARHMRPIVSGYDPNRIVRLAGTPKGIAVVFIVLSTIGAAVAGLILGSALSALVGSTAPAIILPFLAVGAALLFSYLGTLVLRSLAEGMITLGQIEMNTRSGW
ncbi:MAG: hypothetical protein LLG08_07320 [Actinomycetia bacterium]|nr:hypothetical protein [Actinomycetes bacterium]